MLINIAMNSCRKPMGNALKNRRGNAIYRFLITRTPKDMRGVALRIPRIQLKRNLSLCFAQNRKHLFSRNNRILAEN